MSSVIVLDYPGPEYERRIKSLGLGRHVLEEVRPREMTIGRHARQLADRTGHTVHLVIAYCAATAIGREFARLVGARRLVAINPETPEPSAALAVARTVIGDPALREVTADRLDSVESVLIQRYDADLGGDLPLARELASAQIDWVYHLAAAADPNGGSVLPTEVHLTSADRPCPADCPAEHLPVDVPSAEMFTSARVRDLLTREVRNAELRDLPDITSSHEASAAPYERALLARPVVHNSPELQRFGQELARLLDILADLPDRCFGGSIEAFLAAQGRPSRAASVIFRGCVGDFYRYGRADSILSEEGFRVIEFNLGSDVGGVDIARINGFYLDDPGFRAFAEQHGLTQQDPALLLARQIRQASGSDDPVVCLVQENNASRSSCPRIAQALEQHGLRVELAELADIATVDGRISVRNSVLVDVVLRYFFVEHVLRDPDSQRAMDQLVRAHRAGTTILFTGFDSEIYGNKAVLALLHLDVVQAALSGAERELVRRLVPWTALVGAGFGIIGPSERHRLIEECMRRRAELVLKPAFGNNSVGVRLGARMTDEEWAILLRAPVSSDCVVQEYVPSAAGQLDGYLANWGVFVDDGGYGGVCLRALSTKDRGVIGGSDGTMMGGVFTYEQQG